MAEAELPKPRAARRRWPVAEKRRIVELTLHAGASIGVIAHEHGVHATSLHHWKALYRAGKLDAQVPSASRSSSAKASATFVPVSIVPTMRELQSAGYADAGAYGSSVVELMFASGVRLRIETGALDAALVCALVAELRR